MAGFSPEFLSRLSEIGNEYQKLSEKHEQLQQKEQQLLQQKQKLQEEVQQLQEGRTLLLNENRSLIEKLQATTEEKQQRQADLDKLEESKRAISVQLADRDEEIIQLQQQLRVQHEAYEKQMHQYHEKHEQLQRENADLAEKLKNVNKRRQDAADQLRLVTEEQQRQAEEIISLQSEKQQLIDWKKQQMEESRLLAGRVRTLTTKQKQLQEEKQQVITGLQRQQEDQQQKWERRVRGLEQLRDETLAQLKSLEEDKTKEAEERVKQEIETQHWQVKAGALEDELQRTTLELHRVQDALNTEKNIVEENKQRHKLDVQECIRRAAEEQNALKQTYVTDYRRACDEIERCCREKHHLVETVLEFARAHGCIYYSQPLLGDCGEAPDGSSSRRSRSSGSSTAASPSSRSADAHRRDILLTQASHSNAAAVDASQASSLNGGSTGAAGATERSQLHNAKQQQSAAAVISGNEKYKGRLQDINEGDEEVTRKRPSAVFDGVSAASCIDGSAGTPASASSSVEAVPAALRLIGARIAALEAATQTALQEKRRTYEEVEALQKILTETAEKARAATDAKQQLSLRFCTVMQGIRELTEKATFEQQLVRPLLAEPLQRCCASLSGSHSISLDVQPQLTRGCCEVGGGSGALSLATDTLSAVTETRRISCCSTDGVSAHPAALEAPVTDKCAVTQRANAAVREKTNVEDFVVRTRKKEGSHKEKGSILDHSRAAEGGNTKDREQTDTSASGDGKQLIAHPDAGRTPLCEEGEKNGTKERLLCYAFSSSNSKTERALLHKTAVLPYEKGGQMVTPGDDPIRLSHVYDETNLGYYERYTPTEAQSPSEHWNSAYRSQRRCAEGVEKQMTSHLTREVYDITPSTSPASAAMNSTADISFCAGESISEESPPPTGGSRIRSTGTYTSTVETHKAYINRR